MFASQPKQTKPSTGAPASSPRTPGQARHSTTGWRARLRRTPGGAHLLKVLVFLAGLAFILLGVVLVALPGPLTIPPMLIGLYLWSTEFAWADRLLDRAKASAHDAWESAKARPVVSALVTGGGIMALVLGLYLVSRYELIDRAREAVGL